jgi:ornithine cyclodeaminase/alanine dehydrogenase-like protein (mu-crystallin family)
MSDGKRYTVGIVGCGRVAALHAEAYTLVPGTQLVAAADIDADKLDLFCERWSIPQRYGVGARRLPAGDPGQSVRRYAGQRSDIARESPCARR